MDVPSGRVCVVSVEAVAENGAPLTAFPPCKPSNPISSTWSPNGPGPPGPPGPPCIMTSGAGGASCARVVPTPSNNAAASAVQAKHLRFISVLLFSPERFQRNFLCEPPNPWRTTSPQLRRSVLRPYKIAPLLRLRQANGLRLSVLTDEQVNLNPFVGALFVDGQAEVTEGAALHANTHDGTVARFLSHAAGKQREILGIVGGNEGCFVSGLGRVIVDCRVANCDPSGICRGGNVCVVLSLRCTLEDDVFAGDVPVPPAHTNEQQRRGGENPGRSKSETPNPQCTVAREEFLTKAHFDSKRRAGIGGHITESLKLDLSLAPGLLQSGATRAAIGVIDRGGTFDGVDTIWGFAIEIQTNGFKLFAVHVATSLLATSYHSRLPRKKFTSSRRSARGAESARDIAQNLKLGEQQSAAAMETRADRADRASDALRGFLVAQLFQLAKHDGFAEFARQLQHGGANLLHTLLALGPVHRRHDSGEAGDGARSGFALVVELELTREALEVFHDAIPCNAVEIGGERSAL